MPMLDSSFTKVRIISLEDITVLALLGQRMVEGV